MPVGPAPPARVAPSRRPSTPVSAVGPLAGRLAGGPAEQQQGGSAASVSGLGGRRARHLFDQGSLPEPIRQGVAQHRLPPRRPVPLAVNHAYAALALFDRARHRVAQATVRVLTTKAVQVDGFLRADLASTQLA